MIDFKTLLKSTTNRLVLITVLIHVVLQQALYARAITGFEMFSWQTPYFQPWQLLTHMFLHGGWGALGV